MFEGQGHIS